MSGMSTVSVILPTYYRNDRLREAILSVQDQTYEPVELIVVDDSGEGYASPVVHNFDDATYISLERNRGAHAAREIGFKQSSGEFIQFLDDDDRLCSQKIEKQVAVLESDSDVGVVYSGKRWETGETELPNPEVRGDVLIHALKFAMAPCFTSMMLIRRSHLEDIPFYRDLGGADDIAMRIELARRTRFEYVDEPLVIAGKPESTLGTSWSSIEGRKKILERYRRLYNQFDPDVRATALAETYSKEGRRHLDDKLWSARAIRSFALALYHDPDNRIQYWGEFVTSIFGRPGRELGKIAKRIIT